MLSIGADPRQASGIGLEGFQNWSDEEITSWFQDAGRLSDAIKVIVAESSKEATPTLLSGGSSSGWGGIGKTKDGDYRDDAAIQDAWKIVESIQGERFGQGNYLSSPQAIQAGLDLGAGGHGIWADRILNEFPDRENASADDIRAAMGTTLQDYLSGGLANSFIQTIGNAGLNTIIGNVAGGILGAATGITTAADVGLGFTDLISVGTDVLRNAGNEGHDSSPGTDGQGQVGTQSGQPIPTQNPDIGGGGGGSSSTSGGGGGNMGEDITGGVPDFVGGGLSTILGQLEEAIENEQDPDVKAGLEEALEDYKNAEGNDQGQQSGGNDSPTTSTSTSSPGFGFGDLWNWGKWSTTVLGGGNGSGNGSGGGGQGEGTGSGQGEGTGTGTGDGAGSGEGSGDGDGKGDGDGDENKLDLELGLLGLALPGGNLKLGKFKKPSILGSPSKRTVFGPGRSHTILGG